MKRPRFFDARDESQALRAALLPLDVAALLYGAAARAHRALYRVGWRRPARLGCRVVSVGNPVVGGSGKTPFAAWLAAELRSRGHRVVLASRGYGRRGRSSVEVVSDGRFVRSSAEEAGDEPLVLAAHAPGVPVLVGPSRAVVGLRALSAFGAGVLVLDDGFQHHALARDLDLLVLDGRAGLGNGRVLPRGPLREPLAAVALANAIGVLDGPLPERDEALLRRLAPKARRFEARRVPAALRPLGGGEGQAPGWLAGRAVGLLCGIARPAAFRRTLEALGARVVAERCFADHHVYRPRDLAGLSGETPLWITTEKDAFKILPAWTGGADVRVLVIELEVDGAEPLLDWVEERLHEKPKGRDARLRQPVAR
jgi:tetraacyldisaccharide 4'-kinase